MRHTSTGDNFGFRSFPSAFRGLDSEDNSPQSRLPPIPDRSFPGKLSREELALDDAVRTALVRYDDSTPLLAYRDWLDRRGRREGRSYLELTACLIEAARTWEDDPRHAHVLWDYHAVLKKDLYVEWERALALPDCAARFGLANFRRQVVPSSVSLPVAAECDRQGSDSFTVTVPIPLVLGSDGTIDAEKVRRARESSQTFVDRFPGHLVPAATHLSTIFNRLGVNATFEDFERFGEALDTPELRHPRCGSRFPSLFKTTAFLSAFGIEDLAPDLAAASVWFAIDVIDRGMDVHTLRRHFIEPMIAALSRTPTVPQLEELHAASVDAYERLRFSFFAPSLGYLWRSLTNHVRFSGGTMEEAFAAKLNRDIAEPLRRAQGVCSVPDLLVWLDQLSG